MLLLRPTHQKSSTEIQRSWDSLWRTWTSSKSTTSGWWLTTRTELALHRKRSLCAPTQTLPANLRTMSRSKRPVPRSVLLHVLRFSHFLDKVSFVYFTKVIIYFAHQVGFVSYYLLNKTKDVVFISTPTNKLWVNIEHMEGQSNVKKTFSVFNSRSLYRKCSFTMNLFGLLVLA